MKINFKVQQHQTDAVDNSKIADDILKFKNLLDIGAITQEEFEARKNILGL